MAKRQRNLFVRILLGLALALAVIIVFFFVGYLIGTHFACMVAFI